MTTVIFHVGTPKTGSSALQVSLAKMGDTLAANGLNYISTGEFNLGKSGKISSGNGAYLARTLLNSNDPSYMNDYKSQKQLLFDAITQSIAQSRKYIVVSSELFTFADPASFRALVDAIRAAGHEAKCFYFIRSPVQSISSSYIQQVKRHHCTQRPEYWVERQYKSAIFLKTYTFYQSMQNIFGAHEIICRSYDAAILHPGGTVKIFLDAIGVEIDQSNIEGAGVNVGLTSEQIALMLILNRYRPKRSLIDALVDLNEMRGLFPVGHKHNFLPLNLVSEIEEYYEEENHQLANVYFQRKWLFPPYELTTPSPVPDSNEIPLANVIEFFSSLVVAGNK